MILFGLVALVFYSWFGNPFSRTDISDLKISEPKILPAATKSDTTADAAATAAATAAAAAAATAAATAAASVNLTILDIPFE